MKFMMTYQIKGQDWGKAISRFLETGAPAPAGAKLAGRWHSSAGRYGFILIESEDPGAIYRFASEWADLCEFTINPVIEDQEAGAVLSNLRK